MEFPNEIMRYILEIKYNTWLEFRKCSCSRADFKKCDFARCVVCNDIFCYGQQGLFDWIWTCMTCEKWHCGKHLFYEIDNNTGWGEGRLCTDCLGNLCVVEMNEKRKPKPLPKKKALKVEK